MTNQKPEELEIGLQVEMASRNNQRERKLVLVSRKRLLGQYQIKNREKTICF